MTNQAIAWARFQQALTPDKPFYMYFATGADARAAPRAQGVHRQVQGQVRPGLGQAPRGDAGAADRAGRRPGGHQADANARRRSRRGIRSRPTRSGCSPGRWKPSPASPSTPTTRSAGWCKALEDMGELDNTLLFYIVGDNGSSAEGGPDGTYNEMLALNGIISDLASQLPHIDEWGGPTTFPHFSIGWAHAGNTPFQWTKQVASHFGGTRNPLVVHWPEGHQGQGRGALAVPSRDRRGADRARSGRAARADDRSTARSSGRWTASRCCTRSTTPRPRTAAPRSTSRCSATAPSTTTAGWRRRGTRFRG